MATIGRLNLFVGVNTSGLTKGVTALKSFAATAASVATGMIAADVITGIGKSIANFAVDSFKAADAVGDLADRLGVAVAPLSELMHASDMVDVSRESLTTGLGFFTKQLAKSGQATNDILQPLMDVADAVASAKTQTDQGAIAVKNFGKGGLELLPLLRQGSAGIQTFAADAKELGVSFDKIDIARIGKADAAIKRMKAAVSGLGVAFASGFAPIVEIGAKFATSVLKPMRPIIAAIGDTLAPAFERISASFKEVANADFVKLFDGWKTQIIAAWDGINNAGHSFLTDFIPSVIDGLAEMLDGLNEIVASLGSVAKLSAIMNLANPLVFLDKAKRDAAALQLQTAIQMEGRAGPTAAAEGLRTAADAMRGIPKFGGGLDFWKNLQGRAGGGVAKSFLDQMDIGGVGSLLGAGIVASVQGGIRRFEEPAPLRDATLVSPFISAIGMGLVNAIDTAFGPKGPSSQLPEGLLKGSAEAISFVNRFKAGGDANDPQKQIAKNTDKLKITADQQLKRLESIDEKMEEVDVD